VLASASPRRLQLLRACGLDVGRAHLDVDEAERPDESAANMVLRLAREKARAVSGALVVAADTTVVLDGRILAKPADARAAGALDAVAARFVEGLAGGDVRLDLARRQRASRRASCERRSCFAR
jgi:septum formation protein